MQPHNNYALKRMCCPLPHCSATAIFHSIQTADNSIQMVERILTKRVDFLFFFSLFSIFLFFLFFLFLLCVAFSSDWRILHESTNAPKPISNSKLIELSGSYLWSFIVNELDVVAMTMASLLNHSFTIRSYHIETMILMDEDNGDCVADNPKITFTEFLMSSLDDRWWVNRVTCFWIIAIRLTLDIFFFFILIFLFIFAFVVVAEIAHKPLSHRSSNWL